MHSHKLPAIVIFLAIFILLFQSSAFSDDIEKDKTGSLPDDVLERFMSKYSAQDWLNCFGLATPVFAERFSQRLDKLTPDQRALLFRRLERNKFEIIARKMDGDKAVLTVKFPDAVNADVRFVIFNSKWKIDSVGEYSSLPEEKAETKVIDSEKITPFSYIDVLVLWEGKPRFFGALEPGDAAKCFEGLAENDRDKILKMFWRGGRLKDILTADAWSGAKKSAAKLVLEREKLGDISESFPEEIKQIVKNELPDGIGEDAAKKLSGLAENIKSEYTLIERLNWLRKRFSDDNFPLWDCIWFAESLDEGENIDENTLVELFAFYYFASQYSVKPGETLFSKPEQPDYKAGMKKIISFIDDNIESMQKELDENKKTYRKILDESKSGE